MTGVRRALVAVGAGIWAVGAYGLAAKADWPTWAAGLASLGGLVVFFAQLRGVRVRRERREAEDEAAVLACIESGTGYATDMMNRLDMRSDRIYVALARLERRGVVRSGWEDQPSGPRRRLYRLATPDTDAEAADVTPGTCIAVVPGCADCERTARRHPDHRCDDLCRLTARTIDTDEGHAAWHRLGRCPSCGADRYDADGQPTTALRPCPRGRCREWHCPSCDALWGSDGPAGCTCRIGWVGRLLARLPKPRRKATTA